jgi:hypothetical protein
MNKSVNHYTMLMLKDYKGLMQKTGQQDNMKL